ncbi:MAG: radical SAM protein, partial [Clostridia bacterium]|nr:radical SAM protein [Clostridia bacterium]
MYNKVYVEITNICNMHCSFCHGHRRPLRQMTRDEFAYILDALTDHTQYIYYHLMGEPLTHPELPVFVTMAGEKGYKSIITTNGTLLGMCGEDLLAAGVHKVNISLHSFEQGSEADCRRYVEMLADFAQKAAGKGTLVVFRLWNQGADEGRNAFALNVLKARLPGAWRENTRGIRICDKVYIEFGVRFAWPDCDAEIQGTKFFCYGLKDQFGILVDGTVVPCCLDSEGIINLGNVFKEDLSTILAT